MRASCDILLIGGGVLGVSIAYHLACRRAGRVVLLEKSFLGAGAHRHRQHPVREIRPPSRPYQVGAA